MKPARKTGSQAEFLAQARRISEFEINELSERVVVILSDGTRVEPGAEWFAAHCDAAPGDEWDEIARDRYRK